MSFLFSIVFIAMIAFDMNNHSQLMYVRCHMKAEARRTSVVCRWALISKDGSGNQRCPLKLVSWRSFGLHELCSASERHHCSHKGQTGETNITKPVCHCQYLSMEIWANGNVYGWIYVLCLFTCGGWEPGLFKVVNVTFQVGTAQIKYSLLQATSTSQSVHPFSPDFNTFLDYAI